MPVIINIHGDDAQHALRELSALAAGVTLKISPVPAPSGVAELGKSPAAIAAVESSPSSSPTLDTGSTESSSVATASPSEAPKATRAPRGSKKAAEAAKPVEAPQVSDTAADKAQDAADEAAETASKATGALTHDDVRNAVGEYIAKFGMARGATDIPGIIGGTIDSVPNDQAALQKAINAIKAAIAGSGAATAPVAAKVYTKDDVKAAVLAYAKKYDTDLQSIPNTQADVSSVLISLFGENQQTLSTMPNDSESLAKAVTAIADLTANNPFGRAVVGV